MHPIALSLLVPLLATSLPLDRGTQLPAPRTRVGMSVEEALANRHSTKKIAPTPPLTRGELAQILWAATGVNRPAEAKRTAPSALACYGVTVYVADATGLYRYLPRGHRLETVPRPPGLGPDLRAKLVTQAPYREAPTILLLVIDIDAYPERFPATLRERFAATETGFIGQNVYLQCAALGLGCVFIAGVDGDFGRKALALAPSQTLLYAIPIGHPK